MRLRFFLVGRPISSYFYNGRRRHRRRAAAAASRRRTPAVASRNGGHCMLASTRQSSHSTWRTGVMYLSLYIIFARFVGNRGLNVLAAAHETTHQTASSMRTLLVFIATIVR